MISFTSGFMCGSVYLFYATLKNSFEAPFYAKEKLTLKTFK